MESKQEQSQMPLLGGGTDVSNVQSETPLPSVSQPNSCPRCNVLVNRLFPVKIKDEIVNWCGYCSAVKSLRRRHLKNLNEDPAGFREYTSEDISHVDVDVDEDGNGQGHACSIIGQHTFATGACIVKGKVSTYKSGWRN